MTTSPTTEKKIVLGTPRLLPALNEQKLADEIISAPFPEQRSLKWAPATGATFTPPVPLVIAQEVLCAVNKHVAHDLSKEIGGFLLGNRYRCPQTGQDYVLIDNCYKARFTKGDATSLHFTENTWADLADKLSTRFYGKLLVGWYHSHPRMDIFLSEDDLQVHQSRFTAPWACALVLEPEKSLAGFFVAQDGALSRKQPVAFYEYLAHNQRDSVVCWKNYVSGVTDEIASDDFDLNEANTEPEELPGTPVTAITPLPHSTAVPRRQALWKTLAAAAVFCFATGLGIHQAWLHGWFRGQRFDSTVAAPSAQAAYVAPPVAAPTAAPSDINKIELAESDTTPRQMASTQPQTKAAKHNETATGNKTKKKEPIEIPDTPAGKVPLVVPGGSRPVEPAPGQLETKVETPPPPPTPATSSKTTTTPSGSEKPSPTPAAQNKPAAGSPTTN